MNSETLVISSRSWFHGHPHQIPLNNARSVIVERKSLMPVASSAVLAGIIGVLLRDSALWFPLDLNSNISGKISELAFLAATLLAVPTIERAVFVNVIISSLNAGTWHVRFVTSNAGRNLAAKFLELSSGA